MDPISQTRLVAQYQLTTSTLIIDSLLSKMSITEKLPSVCRDKFDIALLQSSFYKFKLKLKRINCTKKERNRMIFLTKKG